MKVNIQSLVIFCGPSHSRSALVDVEYRNCDRTFNDYLRCAIWIVQIQSKFLNGLVTNGLDGM